MMWKLLAAMGVWAVLLVSAFVLGYAIGSWRVDCPTEDSCTPVYEDGAWQIKKVIP